MDKNWQTLTCKGRPTGRHETAFVECGGLFYLIGGREADGRIDRLDPRTSTWHVMEAKSPLIHHFQPVVLSGVIYMVGAMTGGYPTEPPMERIQIYDPEADEWSEGGEIPEGRRRGGSGAVVHEGKIYVACGITYGHTDGTNNWFDVYDPETDTWAELEDAPRIRDHFHAVVVDHRMYCIGGRNTSYHEPDNFGAFFGAVILEIDVYDFRTCSWSTLPESANLPVGSAAAGVAQVGDKIVYFGGETAEIALSDTRMFDPETNEWKTLPPLNQGRHGTQAIVHEDRIYVAAGSPNRGGGNLDSTEVFG